LQQQQKMHRKKRNVIFVSMLVSYILEKHLYHFHEILIYWLIILKCQIAIKSTKILFLQPECMRVLGKQFENTFFLAIFE